MKVGEIMANRGRQQKTVIKEAIRIIAEFRQSQQNPVVVAKLKDFELDLFHQLDAMQPRRKPKPTTS